MNIDNIRWLYRINDNVLKVNTDEITPDEALHRPEPGGNCVNWIIGHLLRSRQFLLKYLNTEWAMPEGTPEIYKRGSSGDGKDEFIPYDKLHDMWDETQNLLMTALDNLTPEQLDEEVGALGDFAKPESRERRILFLYFHETYHIGQLGLLRRLVGKEGAIK